MEEKAKNEISDETVELIHNFSENGLEKNIQKDNEKTVSSAVLYEKFRVAIEYQEEHLILKNAINRILRRHIALTMHPTIELLYSNLITELSWSNYLNPESLTVEDSQKIQSIIDRYFNLLNLAQSAHFSHRELQSMIIEWMSVEIEEYLKPQNDRIFYVNFVANILKKNLTTGNLKISDEEIDIQLKLAIFNQLFKPDYPLMQFVALTNVYPDWQNFTKNEIKAFARSFDPYYNKIDRALNHPRKKRFVLFVKRYIAPFRILYRVLKKHNLNSETVKNSPGRLHDLIMEEYNLAVLEAKQKVWRATFRALIFILLTKISLAFIIEIPFDKIFVGHISYLSLVINITLPPLLMLLAGTSVKSPSKKNYEAISVTTSSVLTQNKIGDKKFSLAAEKQASIFAVFNYFYSLFSLGVLAAVIWLLILLQFNFVSILLFFLFVSVVSFFSFRIRNIVIELIMKRSKDDAVTSVMELIFLPFIRIGKFFSDRLTNFNPFILALDFFIEAPLKTIIRIVTSWFKFINTKKEDLEF